MSFAKPLAKTGMFGLAGQALSKGKKKSSESGPVHYVEDGRRVMPARTSLLSTRTY